MHYTGHIGIGFLVGSPLYLGMRWIGVELAAAITITAMAAFLAWLPDLDMQFGIKHRGITHTIPFAALVSFLISLFFMASLLAAVGAFLALFLALVVHIFGDMLNIVKMEIFYPFSKKKYGGWKFFKSGNQAANYNLFIGGIIVYALVLSFF